MPPSRNNTVKFTDLQAISSVNAGDIIPVVDTSVPTLVNKKINVQDFSRSLPVSQQVAQMGTVSANWNSNYSTTLANSASWSTGGSYGSVYSANSAEYESTYSSVNANSANWDSAYTALNNISGVYTTVQSVSDSWGTGTSLASSAYASLNALSAGTWLLKAGDQLTGTLTTTKTLTTQFTNMDELVSKRYVDAVSTISGNFVPSLYYTKNDFSTGVPLVCATSLQTNAFALGTAGGSQTGILSFNPNLYGTGVTGFTLDSTNNRTGLRIIAGAYNRFNASEQGLSYVWGGPTFQQNIFTLGDSSGNNVMAVDHYGPYYAAPLTNSVVLRCTTPSNFFINNYSTVSIAPKWNNAATTFTGVSISAIDAGSTTSSNLLDLQTNGISQLVVRKDGLMQSRASIYDAIRVSGLANISSGTGALLTFINPFDGTVGLASTSMVQWGDPGNGTPFNNQGDVLVTRDEAGVLSLRPNTVNAGPQSVRVYRRYVNNTTNFERFGLSGNRIAYELSGSQRFFIGATANSDIEIAATGNLSLNAGGSLSFSQSLPTSFAGLQATAPSSPSSSYFKILSSNNLTLFNINSAGRVSIRGRSSSVTEDQMNFPSRELELVGFTQPIMFRHSGNNTGFIVDEFGHGLYSDSGGCYIGSGGSGTRVYVVGGGINLGFSNTGMMAVNSIGKVRIGRGIIDSSNTTTVPAPSAHVQIITDSSYNSHVSDMLLLSAGPNVSISNYINCVNAGQTIFSVNSAGSVFYNIFQNNIFDNFNVARFKADGVIIQTDATGGRASWHDVSVNNYAANNGNAPLASARGQWNFPSVLNAPTAFTLNNQIYLLNNPSNTQLISVSSNRGRVGFRFEPVEVGNNRPEIYSDGNLYITNNFGGGRRIYFNGSDNQLWNPFELGYNGAFAYGTIEITATQQPGSYTWPYLKITQAAKQLGHYIQAINTAGSTIFQVSSSNNVVVTNLLNFVSETASGPALRGSSSTIQARTGDGSQYTFLQGKLQTDQAANAGTFTPDKYLILYDSTGTAYKVPVQAL